jgi:hypothetical protein
VRGGVDPVFRAQQAAQQGRVLGGHRIESTAG